MPIRTKITVVFCTPVVVGVGKMSPTGCSRAKSTGFDAFDRPYEIDPVRAYERPVCRAVMRSRRAAPGRGSSTLFGEVGIVAEYKVKINRNRAITCTRQ